MRKIIVSLLLCISLIITIFPFGIFDLNVMAATYPTDYKKWSQGASSYDKMNGYGCWVVAQAKLIYECNIDRSSSFNPDTYMIWEQNNGYLNSNFYQVNGVNAPVAYAKSKGKVLNYLGCTSSSVETKIWDNISKGYKSIVYVTTSGGYSHYIMIANDLSSANGKLYCYDSWSGYSSVSPQSIASRNYRSINEVYSYSSSNSSIGTHTHNHAIYEYEAAHPHKYYKKCSCGDYYYTGETAKVSTCSECKGVTIQNIGVENVTNSNAYVKSIIYKPTLYAVEQIGVKIRQEGKTYTEEWKFHKQAPSSSWTNRDNLNLEWDLSSECGYKLTHATRYYYKMYAKINGVEYYSQENSFTTTGSHSYGSWSTTSAATCTATGTQTRKCSCGKTETKTITALGHSFSQSFTVDKKATCAEEGSKSKHCTRCSAKSEITAIPVLTTHSSGGFVTTEKPTCTDAGTFKTTCTICEKTWFGTEPALGHEFSSEWVIDKQATCNSQGSKSHHCKRCDAKSEITTINSLSHQWGDWETIKEPTTTSVGQKQRTCKREGCSEKETMIIAKLAQDGHTHKYNDWVVIKPSTCTENGTQEHTCTVCGEKENQSISKTEHTFGEWIVVIAATEDGNGLEKRVCSECKVEETRDISELIENTDGLTKEEILEQNNIENIELDNGVPTDSKVDKVEDNNSNESSSNEDTYLVLFISSAALLVVLGTVLTIVLIKRKNK